MLIDLFCNRCGYNNSDGNIYCVRCGHRNTYLSSENQNRGNILNSGVLLQNRYKIIKSLGRGGMGVVYLAGDNRFSNKLCVVKEMMEFLLNDYDRQKAIARFNQEADLLASINHPNIPQVYDRFSEDNRHYLVMEFVQGMDFKELIKEHMRQYKCPLPEEHVLIYFMQICSTLKYLHNHKPVILHRDIKPSNILLTGEGIAKLIDFGIAKTIQANTQGTSVGTQGYAAPEQYKGLADSRTDIYALGATIHHLVTGRDPQKETPFDYPPARTLYDGVSQEFSDIIDWMLQTDINKRAQNIDSIIERIKLFSPDIDQKVMNYSLENNNIIGIITSKLKPGDNDVNISRAFCIYCGFENKAGDRFCSGCGKPIENSGQAQGGFNTNSQTFMMIIPGNSRFISKYPLNFREYINVPVADGSMRVNVVLESYKINENEYIYITEKLPSISGHQVSVYSAHRNVQGVLEYIKPVTDPITKQKLNSHWIEMIKREVV